MNLTKTARTASLLIVGLGLAVNGYSQSFLTNGLIAYYPFNGNANDESGNGNNGTIYGATLTSDRFGTQGKAMAFNGTNQYIQAPHQAYLSFATGDFTIGFWVVLNDLYNPQYFMGKDPGQGPNNKWELFLGSGNPPGTASGIGFMAATLSGGPVGSWYCAPTDVKPVPGTWHQLLFTKSATNYAVHLDGVAVSRGEGPPNLSSNNTSPLTIGWAEGPAFFNGELDDIRIYNRALSDSEVLQLYKYESVPTLPPYLNLSINVTAFLQNTNDDNGVVTITASPKTVTYATRDFLNVLAFDQHQEGNWPSNSFPNSAKLAIADDGFVVVSGTNVLLNVSDIMSLSRGENEITSGVQDDSTGLASHTAQKRQIARITFDDTFIVGGKNLKFYLQGLLTQSTTDTTPAAGIYTDIRTVKITNAAGEGSFQNVPFVCTGTVTATGRSALSL